MSADDVRPLIPASCSHRPIVGGLVAPYVNVQLADGTVDFRTPHQGRHERCWTEQRCQTCGGPCGPLAVLLAGPRQLAELTFDEAPLCPPCAAYASRACPMVAGRMDRYADRTRISDTSRGHVCPDAGCECGGFVASDPNATDASGDPAHPWFAVFVRTGEWDLIGKVITVACADGGPGCLHERTLINGARLTTPPVKVIAVSEPGVGRVWRKLTCTVVSSVT